MANEFKVRKGLIVYGSGSSTVLDVQGSQGQLFSITDSLSGSLWSVNDISGIPVMEAFSDNTVKIGTFGNEAIIVSGSSTGMGTATPTAKLHISGSSNSALFEIDSPEQNNIFFVSGSGNVGIGTNTPTQTLDVNGSARFTGITTFSSAVLLNGAVNIAGSNSLNVKAPISAQNLILGYDTSIPYVYNYNGANFGVYLATNGTTVNKGVGIGALSLHDSAIFHITSTTKGALLPRMTIAQRDAISSPAQGLMVYVTSSASEGLYYYNSGSYQGWTKVLNNSGSQSITGSINIVGELTNTGPAVLSGSLQVTEGITGSLFGTASYVNITSLGGVTGTGSNGQIAYWNGTTTQTGSNNLFWDAANNRLGVGVGGLANTTNLLTVGQGTINLANSSTYAIRVGTGSDLMTISTNVIQSWNGKNLLLNSQGNGVVINSQSTTSNSLLVSGVTQLNGNVTISAGNTPSARLHVQGSGTTSATTALLVQNSTPTELFKVLDNGAWNFNGDGSILGGIDVRKNTGLLAFFGSTTGSTRFEISSNGNVLLGLVGWIPTTNGGISTTTGAGGCFIGYNAVGDLAYQVTSVTLGRPLDRLLNATVGGQKMVDIVGNFSPTSGTATFYDLAIIPTINQTGGANGITRGLYVNPTLTSASDWRGIESVAASNANHTLLKLRNATVDVFTVKADSKIGFFNATPVAQPTTGIAEATFVENSGGTAVNVDSTFAGYTIQQIAQALKDIGILA